MNIVERYNLQTNNIRYAEPPKTMVDDVDWSYLVDSRISSTRAYEQDVISARLEFNIPANMNDVLERMRNYFQGLNGRGSMEMPIGGFRGTRYHVLRNVRYGEMFSTFDYNSYSVRFTVTLHADEI